MIRSRATYGSRGTSRGADAGIRSVAPTFGKEKRRTSSAKSAGGVLVESYAECVVAHALDISPDVLRFQTQPFRVDLVDRCIHRESASVAAARAKHIGREGPIFYTPDFLVERHDNRLVALEVKMEDYSGDAEYVRKLELVRPVLESFGYAFFTTVVSSSPHDAVRRNVGLLKQAKMRFDLVPSEKLLAEVEAACGGNAFTLKWLCQTFSISPNTVPVWLVCGAVSANLRRQPIDGAMNLELAHGDLSHLNLLGEI